MSTELRINWSTFPTSKYRSFHRFSKKKLSRIDWHFLSFPSYSDQDSHTPSHITCFNGIPLQNTWIVSSQLFIDIRPLGKNGMNLSRVPIFPNLSKIWYSIYILYSCGKTFQTSEVIHCFIATALFRMAQMMTPSSGSCNDWLLNLNTDIILQMVEN